MGLRQRPHGAGQWETELLPIQDLATYVKEQNVDRRVLAVKGPSNEQLDVQERCYRIVAVLLEILGFLAIDKVHELRIFKNDDLNPSILT